MNVTVPRSRSGTVDTSAARSSGIRPFHKPGAGCTACPRCWRSRRTAVSSSCPIEQTPTSRSICSSTPTTDARAIPAVLPSPARAGVLTRANAALSELVRFRLCPEPSIWLRSASALSPSTSLGGPSTLLDCLRERASHRWQRRERPVCSIAAAAKRGRRATAVGGHARPPVLQVAHLRTSTAAIACMAARSSAVDAPAALSSAMRSRGVWVGWGRTRSSPGGRSALSAGGRSIGEAAGTGGVVVGRRTDEIRVCGEHSDRAPRGLAGARRGARIRKR